MLFKKLQMCFLTYCKYHHRTS